MRNFSTVPTKNYIGAPSMQAANICKSGTMNIVPFTVPWAIYLLQNTVTQIGVEIDLSAIPQVKDFPQVRSVYIDNEGNNVPVWVRFPDTNHTVACQPNAAGWFPVFTNSWRAVLYGVGFTPADFLSATAVYFCDTFIPPYVDNELVQSVGLMKASPTIQRGLNIYNSLYAAPALGDQTTQVVAQPNASYDAQVLSVRTSGFYYVTGICLTAQGIVQGVGSAFAEALFMSTGVSGVLYDFWIFAPQSTGFGATLNQTIFNQTGLQLKLDATENWRFRNQGSAMGGGVLELFVNYTYQP